MCLAIPARVLSVNGLRAVVSALGFEDDVDVRLVPEVRAGEYVLVHAGFAIQKVQEGVATELTALWSEVSSRGTVPGP